MISIFIKIAVIATVVAVATTGIIVGVIVGVVPTTTENACATLRAPTDLRIVPVPNFLTVSWTNSDDCADHYEVVVEENGIAETATTKVPYHVFEHTTYCSPVTITVTRIAENDTRSSPTALTYTRSVNPGFGIVTDLTLTRIDDAKVMVRWVGPTGFDQCTMTYKVSVDDEASQSVEGQELEVTMENLEYCTTTTISVVPVIDDIEGTQKEEDTLLKVPAGFAQVTGLTIGPQDNNNNMLVTWAPLAGFDKCRISYVITIDDDTTDPFDDAEYEISMDGLVFCQTRTFYVTPVIGDIQGTPQEGIAEVQVLPGFAKVTELTIGIQDDNDNILVTWVRPAGFTECTISYVITIDDDTTDPFDDAEYEISMDGLVFCQTRTFYVTPVIGDIQGTPQEGIAEVQVLPGFAKVTELTIGIQDDNDNILVTWVRPAGFTECTISYVITIDDDTTDPFDEAAYEIAMDGLVFCQTRTFYVTPVIGDIQGTPQEGIAEVQVLPGFAKVTELTIGIQDDNDNILVTWVRPAGFTECTISYVITIDDDTTDPFDDAEYEISMDGLVFCQTRTFYVTPVIGDIQGTPQEGIAEVQVLPGFAKVTELTIGIQDDNDNILVTWVRPAGFTECTISYVITIDDDTTDPFDDAEYEISMDGLVFCQTRTFYVTPVIGDIQGTPQEGIAEVQVLPGFAKVTELTIGIQDDNDNILVTWVRPAGFTECTISYVITIDDDTTDPFDEAAYEIAMDGLVFCQTRTFYVTPVIGDIQGTPQEGIAEVQVLPGFAKVTELTIGIQDDNDNILVTWVRPAGFTECTISYVITIDDDTTDPFDDAEYEISMDGLVFCQTRTFYVTPVIGDIQGTPQEGIAEVQVLPGFAKVTELTIGIQDDNDNILVTWVRPAGFTECTISYVITIDDDTTDPFDDAEYEISMDGLVFCQTRTFYVTPVIGDIQGTPQEGIAEVQVLPGFAKVTELTIGIQDDNDNILVTWVRPAGFTECTISYVITIDDDTTDPFDDAEYEISMDGLVFCQTRTFYVTPVIGDIQGTPQEGIAEVQVLPGFAKVTELTIGIQDDNDNILVTWVRPAGFTECTISYVITIDDDTTDPFDDAEYEISMDGLVFCQTRTFYVTPVIGDIQGTPQEGIAEVQVLPGFAKVTELTIGIQDDNDNILVTWVRPAGFTECTISYVITIDDDTTDPFDEAAYEIAMDGLVFCQTRTFYVTPVIGDIKGTPQEGIAEVQVLPGFAKVTELTIGIQDDNDNILVTWVRPAGFTECTISYVITIDDDTTDPFDEAAYEIAMDGLVFCQTRTFYVTPVIGDIKGTPQEGIAEVQVLPGFAKVTELTIGIQDDNDNILVTWVRPAGFTECTISYVITIDDDTTDPFDDAEYEISMDGLVFCQTRTFYVTPVIGDIQGTPQEGIAEVQVLPGFAKVTELTIGIQDDNDNILVTWARPAGFSECTISYIITIDDDTTDPFDDAEYEISMDGLVFCQTRTFYVTPVIGDIKGIPLPGEAQVLPCPDNGPD